MTLEQAESRVRQAIYEAKPSMNPSAEFPLRELTTDAVWQRLGVQLFQVTEGVQECETYVVGPGWVDHIASGFGGFGVVSSAVLDLDGNGEDELLYTYSWGSGIHRSHVAMGRVTDRGIEQIDAPVVCYEMQDLMVEVEDQQAFVTWGGRRLLRLTAAMNAGETSLEVEACEELPEGLLHFVSSRRRD